MTYATHSRKGFTLIELLIVVTIIGLLASIVLVGLRGFRSAGRDARRIADLRQIQTGIELYANKCNYYPGGPQPGQVCGLPTNIWSVNPRVNWTGLVEALTGSGLSGVTVIPNDPFSNIPERSYRYNATPDNLGYVLRAELEDSTNSALQNDMDGTFGELDCSDDPPHFYYCTGL